MAMIMSRLLIVSIVLTLFSVAICVPSTKVKLVLCNGGIYSKNGPFSKSLAYVLDELVAITPTKQGYDFHNISPYPNAFAYGHATCTQSLNSSDCATCLTDAKSVILDTCQSRIGGRVGLYACSMRYEQYPFDD